MDGERTDDWFRSIVGPLPDDSPALKAFRSRLAREGMAGESFVLEKSAVPAPRNRRVETASGVRIVFPIDLQNSVVSVDRVKGEIVIKDPITIDDVDLATGNRARQ